MEQADEIRNQCQSTLIILQENFSVAVANSMKYIPAVDGRVSVKSIRAVDPSRRIETD